MKKIDFQDSFPKMRVTFVGTGIVGLVSGACFAEFGWHVTCVDKDADKINKLRWGQLSVHEPELEDLVRRNAKRGLLNFSTCIKKAVKEADVIFLTVGTPCKSNESEVDLQYMYQAAQGLAPHLRGYTVVVIKSTVSPGTTRKMGEAIRSQIHPEASFEMACNPEFLREGQAVQDFMTPSIGIVLGTESERAERYMRKLYQPILEKAEDDMLFVADCYEQAELAKYMNNCFMATKLSFFNEWADLCGKLGIDIYGMPDFLVRLGLTSAPQSGQPMYAGPGYGGSCLPKDTSALVHFAKMRGVETRIIEETIAVNKRRPEKTVKKIDELVGGLKEKRIALLGLSFKPDTDDLREAPALEIIKSLIARGARVRAHDPKAMENAKRFLPPEVDLCHDVYKALEEADAMVLVTPWKEYRELNKRHMTQKMRGRLIIDLPGLYYPEEFKYPDTNHYCIGRGRSVSS